MSKNLFGNNIEPCCSLCEKSEDFEIPKVTVCPIYGTVKPYDCCKHFIYEPLKRDPKKPLNLPKYDKQDFSLED